MTPVLLQKLEVQSYRKPLRHSAACYGFGRVTIRDHVCQKQLKSSKKPIFRTSVPRMTYFWMVDETPSIVDGLLARLLLISEPKLNFSKFGFFPDSGEFLAQLKLQCVNRLQSQVSISTLLCKREKLTRSMTTHLKALFSEIPGEPSTKILAIFVFKIFYNYWLEIYI